VRHTLRRKRQLTHHGHPLNFRSIRFNSRTVSSSLSSPCPLRSGICDLCVKSPMPTPPRRVIRSDEATLLHFFSRVFLSAVGVPHVNPARKGWVNLSIMGEHRRCDTTPRLLRRFPAHVATNTVACRFVYIQAICPMRSLRCKAREGFCGIGFSLCPRAELARMLRESRLLSRATVHRRGAGHQRPSSRPPRPPFSTDFHSLTKSVSRHLTLFILVTCKISIRIRRPPFGWRSGKLTNLLTIGYSPCYHSS
jgi:hypothetical protein